MLSKSYGQTEISHSSTTAFLGEPNAAVRNQKATGQINSRSTYEHILATNPIAFVAFQSMVATLQAAKWEVTNPGKVPKRIEKFVHKLFFEKFRGDLKEVIHSVLLAPGLGAAPHEVTAYDAEGFTWLSDLEYRPLRTFEFSSVYRDDAGYMHAEQNFYSGRFSKYTRVQFGAPGEPGKGLLWWVRYGQTIFGTPILRAIYTEHKTKEEIRRVMAVATQKALLPPPAVFWEDDPPDDKDDPAYANAVQTLDEVGAAMFHEQAVVGVPSAVEKIEPLNEGRGEPIERAIKAMNHVDIQILMAFGAHWMARGVLAQFGSNAAAKVDVSEQRNIRRLYLDWMSSQFDWLIKLFVDHNFGPQDVYPRMCATYKPELEAKEQAEIITRLDGWLSKSDMDEDYIRANIAQLPEKEVSTEPQERSGSKTPATPGAFSETDDTRLRESEAEIAEPEGNDV